MEKMTYIVQEEDHGERIDKLVADKFPNFSRNQIKKMIKDEQVEVNKQSEKPNYHVKWGDIITIYEKDPEITELVPENIPIDIHFQDKDVIVINKASGMVVHPSQGHYTGTLVNAALYHCNHLSGINGELRPGVVHRIDKDTTGLLVMAKNDHAHNFLAKQFKDKTTTREYCALVYGTIAHNKGTIDAPIGRDPKDRKKMAVVAGGRSAVTHFEVVERLGDYTLIKCVLETGRTHQIRVHLRYIDHPLVGDPKYGRRKVIGEKGQFLHAAKLGFIHPTTEEYMEFEVPLPDYFNQFIDHLRAE
ncbi:RluA family pseudouridine synthase [Haloplasma contractile]|uniref:Pseudouridine synthase n=1 Tax=Haloplasma contractile SSD-17B TaxID=1033810 RepID=U2FSB0_9MOLU|nr:RluA family pseudouridine synthase [Haloplasma contractile]ERJ13829.1 malate dehydrogenase protein [Haloplasma contractile SSD-17B]